MSVNNFLELDIKKLFEEHTIKEIEKIHRQIQQESERKKIELRTLVGERYRDLIQAANTIAEMKKTSESIVSRIIDIQENLQFLQEKYSIGFKIEPDKEMQKSEPQDTPDFVIIQIKILMDIPEYIWSAVDNKDFLLATQFFKLAQHINYSLKFELGNAELTDRYPIVGKQWGIISQFRTVISNGCNNLLQSSDLSRQSAANCLASLVLLEETSSAELLNRLISLRCRAINCIITDENDHSVRNRISVSLKMFIETVTLLYACFVKSDESQGLILQYIEKAIKIETSTLLSQLDLDQQLLEKYLPPLTKTYKPFANIEIPVMALGDLQENIKTYLEWTRSFTRSEIPKLLYMVTSVNGIYMIREDSLVVQVPGNWNCIWKNLNLPEVNFWSEFFQPLLTERVRAIIESKWDENLNNLKKNWSDLLIRVSNEKTEYPEHDLRWFMWKDSPSDIPLNLNKTTEYNYNRPLLMKAKGLSPNIVKLCEEFDQGLMILLSDLDKYLYETEKTLSAKENSLEINISLNPDKFADREEIQEDLQAISAKMIDNFIKFVKADCIGNEPKFGMQDVNAIVVARFLRALTFLCSNLRKCFALSRTSVLTITNVKWQEICEVLRKESIFSWHVWAQCYKMKLIEYRDWFLMNEAIEGLRVRSMISEWERVIIEEEAEDGKIIKSEILVPYQPSVNLQQYLSAICKDLNKILPHSLPKSVVNQIINDVVLESFYYYEKSLSTIDLRQKLAIQILFDVKYVTLLMIPRENKSLGERSTAVCNSVSSKIDPFDLDVFYPFIHTNVKKAVQRTLLMFGILIPHLEQLFSVLGVKMDQNSSDKSKLVENPPGVLAVSTGAPWFPPLPVTAPSKNLPFIIAPVLDKTQKNKNSGKEHTRNDSTGSTIKSGAAAFFGAMGTDWFSTS